jgi:endoglucanase
MHVRITTKHFLVLFMALAALLIVLGLFLVRPAKSDYKKPNPIPLWSKSLYNDRSRPIARLPQELQQANRLDDAATIQKISQQPGSIWLTGPTDKDPAANRDISTVVRTSQDAAKQNAVPVYVLYAIPMRDACAKYSSGGFSNSKTYIKWLQAIISAQKTQAIYIVEPDAIAQTVNSSCLTPQQKQDRFMTLKKAATLLSGSNKTLAAYLDAGHMEWASESAVLVKPLQESGVGMLRGIAVNVSNFVPTDQNVRWATQLISMLGGTKRVVIDTSRNGNGAPPASYSGTARWCNPPGRAVGDYPTLNTGQKNIDAYLWIKNIGESDGNCFGNLPAGTFDPNLVINLAKNSQK